MEARPGPSQVPSEEKNGLSPNGDPLEAKRRASRG